MSWFRFSRKNFATIKTSTFQNIHTITLISLSYYILILSELNFFDCINDNIKFFFVKSIEHKRLQKSFSQFFFGFSRLLNKLWNKVFFLIKLAENLCTNSSASFTRSILPLFLYFFIFRWFFLTRVRVLMLLFCFTKFWFQILNF
jgi:hypothetical protein